MGLRVLLVADSPDATRLAAALDGSVHVEIADRHERALTALDGDRFDAVVTVWDLPGPGGAELLAQVARAMPAAYRILLTGADPAGFDALRTTGVADIVLGRDAARQLSWICGALAAGARRNGTSGSSK